MYLYFHGQEVNKAIFFQDKMSFSYNKKVSSISIKLLIMPQKAFGTKGGWEVGLWRSKKATALFKPLSEWTKVVATWNLETKIPSEGKNLYVVHISK